MGRAIQSNPHNLLPLHRQQDGGYALPAACDQHCHDKVGTGQPLLPVLLMWRMTVLS